MTSTHQLNTHQSPYPFPSRSSSQKHLPFSSKKPNLHPLTISARPTHPTILNDRRNQKSPSPNNPYYTSPSISSKSRNLPNLSRRLSPTPVPLKPAPLNLYSTEAYFASNRELNFRSPASPHSIKEMNKLKEKMKLEAEAKEAFLRVITAGRQYEESPDVKMDRSKSLRQFLKNQFESRYVGGYSEHFRKPERVEVKKSLGGRREQRYNNLLESKKKQVRTDWTPMEIVLQPDSLIQYNRIIENTNQNNQQHHQQKQIYYTPNEQNINHEINMMISNNIHKIINTTPSNMNNMFVDNDLELQSHIKEQDSRILIPQQKDVVQQIVYQPNPAITSSNNSNNVHIQHPSFNPEYHQQQSSDYNQPQYLLYQNNINSIHNNNNSITHNIPITLLNSNQIPSLNNLQKSLSNQFQPKSILKNSFKSHKSISFVDLNSNHPKNQQSHYQSNISENIVELDVTEKINQYLQILDMFTGNITEFDDLFNEPNSISGIVGFYLYKRLLVERIRLHRCLVGGSNIFLTIGFYQISDSEIKQFNSINEGQSIIRFIGDQNIGIERNLKLLLDYLKKHTGKDFPKANLNLHDNFQVELRYYLRMEVDQLKNKIEAGGLTQVRQMRLMQRLVFLYETLFLITFFNGKFMKNYELYEDVEDLKEYLKENGQMFWECVGQKK